MVMLTWKINLLLLCKFVYSRFILWATCGLSIYVCLKVQTVFSLGFYLISYDQFCSQGKNSNFFNFCELRYLVD